MKRMTKSIIIFFVGLSFLALILNGAANWVESKPSPPERKFDVVDTYRGCNVVRYTPDYSAKFAYFLDCK
jgi:hypothetical protein